MLKTFKEKYIPSNPKIKWKEYWVIFYPVLLGSMLFALNGFVDNFMVGRYNAAGALAAANTWTNIIFGILAGVAAAGGVVMAQYYHKGNYEMARKIAKVRFILSFIILIPFVIIVWIDPNIFNKNYIDPESSVDKVAAEKLLRQANEYMNIVVYQWILVGVTFNTGTMLREIGHGKATLYWGIGGLITNIVLNSILMYGFDVGVVGAAYATVAARIFVLFYSFYYYKSRRIQIGFYPWEILGTSKEAWTSILKRWYMIVAISSGIAFVTLRTLLYSKAYPIGAIGNEIGALSIVGLTGAITNVFLSTFNVIAIMAANFVAPYLSRNMFDEAKKNSNQLKFFNTMMALGLSILLFLVVSFAPYYTFLVETNDPKITQTILTYVRNTSWIIAAFYPTWIWFISSYKNALSGGHAKFFSWFDWIFTGPIQLGWLLLLRYIANDVDFTLFYFLFYTSDFIKLPAYEIVYKYSNWTKNITESHVAEKHAVGIHRKNADV